LLHYALCQVIIKALDTDTNQFANLEEGDSHLDEDGVGNVERRQRRRFVVRHQILQQAVFVLRSSRLPCLVGPR